MGAEIKKADEAEKSTDKLDKYVDHLLHRAKLTEKEMETLEKYRKAFSWRCKLFGPQQVVSMLMQECNVKYSQAYQIMSDSTRLYGRVEEIDRAGTTRIMIENLHLAMAMAARDKNPEAVIAAVREISKLSRLYEDAGTLSVDELMPARKAVYVQNNIQVNLNDGRAEAIPVDEQNGAD